ncbi:MAG TPA: hypothetical protein EYH31_13315, partial [Anaerolineae bacterium]|nr:hypothetical protein [Anaerolineae bacterium]
MLTGFVIGDRGLGTSGDTHPAWMMAHAVADPYLVVGASAVGQFHLARGLPRDDAFVIRSVGSWLAVGVADGVGSRPLSRYGATYAAESLTAMLLRPFISLPKAVNAEPGTRSLLSDPGGLAPPPRVEEVELTPLIVKKGSGPTALAAGLVDWTRRMVTRAELPPPDEFSPSTFRQAASVGWWPPPAPIDQNPDEVPQSLQAPAEATTQEQDAATNEPQPALDEPSLVAVIRQAFEKTHLGLREHARSLGVELADLSCTALALLLNVETGRGAVGQVGDGALLGLTARGEVKELVSAPDTGDLQSTYTLNRPNFQDYLAVQIIEPPAVDPFLAFYVMTDGLSGDLLYSPKPEALEDWAQKVDRNLRLSASPAQAAAGMLNWLATYQVKGSWDDRTLVVITQEEKNDGDRQSVTG